MTPSWRGGGGGIGGCLAASLASTYPMPITYPLHCNNQNCLHTSPNDGLDEDDKITCPINLLISLCRIWLFILLWALGQWPSTFPKYTWYKMPTFTSIKSLRLGKCFLSLLWEEKGCFAQMTKFSLLCDLGTLIISQLFFLTHWRKLFKESAIQDVWHWLGFSVLDFLGKQASELHSYRWTRFSLCKSLLL